MPPRSALPREPGPDLAAANPKPSRSLGNKADCQESVRFVCNSPLSRVPDGLPARKASADLDDSGT
jgi:hypothetical protein